MNENYLEDVRQSLHSKLKKNIESPLTTQKKSSKIKFGEITFNSEDVFSSPIPKTKTRKSQDVRQSLHSKLKKNIELPKTTQKKSSKIKFGEINFNSEDEFSSPIPKTKTRKSPKRESSFSDDSFQDMTKYEEKLKKFNKKLKTGRTEIQSMYPSSSEQFDLTALQKRRLSNRKLRPKKTEDFEESESDFNLNEFFRNKEQSFNESFTTESHSGIDYEFLSDDMSKVQIKSSRIYDDKKSSVINDKDGINCAIGLISDEIENSIGSNDVFIDNDISEASLKSNSVEIVSTPQRNKDIIEISSEEMINLSTETQESNKSKQVIFQKKSDSYKYFDLGFQKLVILKENYSVPFFGLCSLKVLHGKLDILGCILNKRSKEVNIYSPRGSSLLVVRNITKNNEENDFEEIEPILNSNENLKKVKLDITSVIFICSKIEDCRVKLIEKYISQQIFPKLDASRAPQIIFDPKDKFNILTTNEEWDTVLKYVNASTKLLIAGGKGVGKSTFLRYSINSLLTRFKKIRIIDLDPGQSEFSVPGSISVLTISDPILGPNYTHLQRTQRSYLSNVNIGHDPKKYLQLIQFLMDSLDTTEDIPTLINYMGFAKGIGINIISSAITSLRPTDLIQIESKTSKKNFESDLTLRTVKENCNLFGGDSKNVKFNFKKMFAMTDDNTGWSLESRLTREMCILAYFGEMMKNGAESLTSHNLPMYEIDLNSVQITDADGNNLPPAAVNAGVVALCSRSEDNQIFIVLGYGLIRGIDLEAEYLVLITPEPLDVLDNAIYFVSASVSLPPSVYMSTDSITGPIPYVMEGELEGLGQITKRSYIPANKK